ncbi:MAG: hypothetical protein A2020_02805 [Lentisphaerae bacterium GWF2_45_14]|nr:MAG: hypothetical protein A2020_02805 [Lentisphaerae bacterium GWF2_45_14]
MRVLFLIKSDYTPSSRIRVSDICPLLRNSGIDAQIEIIPSGTWARLRLFSKLSSYDAVVLQKRLLKFPDSLVLRKTAKRLIFDFDDAIYLKNASPSLNLPDYRSFTRRRLFNRTVRKSDIIVAANSILSSEAEAVCGRGKIKIIPSTIDISSIIAKDDYALSSPPVIGWTGTKSTLRYLEFIAPALCKTAKKHDFTLRVVADEKIEIPGVRTEFLKWELDNQYDRIRSFDIGIMPLSSDPFSEGKAAYKLLQYMACAVPSVCSPVGMNLDVAEGGKCALAAASTDEFSDALCKLFEDDSLREKLGKNARKSVEEKYSLETASSLWMDILRS